MPKTTESRLERWIGWHSGAEYLRSKLIYKSLDAALTAPLRPRLRPQDYLKVIFTPKSSNYERVAAGSNLIDAFVPGFARRVSNRLTNTSRFPFSGADIRLMSFGSGSTVFHLKWPHSDWVLKVYRRSLGKKDQSLAQIANHFKDKYDTVCSWYNGRFNLVPQAFFLIIYGPIFSSPAAAVLQTFIHGEKTDFFLDHTDDALLRLMKNDPELAARFLFFAEQTHQIQQQHNLCVDFLGRENLMLVNNNGRRQLLVVDNGIFNLQALQLNAPEVYGRIADRLERLRYLRQELP